MEQTHQLIGELAAVIDSAGSRQDGYRQAAREVAGDATALERMLDTVASDRALAGRIAADSTWHPNGFAKLNLHRHDAPHFRLRLHVWPGEDLAPTEPECSNIHNHRWDFASVVLAGGIHIDEYEETSDFDDPKTVPCRRYSYESAEGSPFGRLHAHGTAALRLIGRYDYEPADTHACATTTLHTVVPFDWRFTATLVVQGPDQSDAALVYQRLHRQAVEDTGLRLTTYEVTRLADMTLTEMAAARV